MVGEESLFCTGIATKDYINEFCYAMIDSYSGFGKMFKVLERIVECLGNNARMGHLPKEVDKFEIRYCWI